MKAAGEHTALHVTDNFQYKVDGLLDEDDFLTHNRPSLNAQASFQLKLLEMETVPETPPNKQETPRKETGNGKIRRKSDISSWSGGVSSLEVRTAFLAYKAPKEFVKLADLARNRRRGITQTDITKKTPKYFPQKTFGTLKDKVLQGLVRRESFLVGMLGDVRTPKKSVDVREDVEKDASGRGGEVKGDNSEKERKKGESEDREKTEEVEIVNDDDGESEIVDLGVEEVIVKDKIEKVIVNKVIEGLIMCYRR